MLDMFCPTCAGHVTRYQGGILTSRSPLVSGMEFKIGEYIACENCALCSEVDIRTGVLVDLGKIRLDDLLVPMDEPIVFVQDPTHPLLGRQDS